MGKLDGKVAVITGGNSGIGLATAKRFAAEGARVFITGRRADDLGRAARDIGNEVTAFQGDVSVLAELDRLYELVEHEAGRIDILFANAGGGDFQALGAITEEHFDRTFATNVKGVLFTVQKALPLMGTGGSIIITGSTTSVTGTPAFSVYSATKAAVRNFVRSLDPRSCGQRYSRQHSEPRRYEDAWTPWACPSGPRGPTSGWSRKGYPSRQSWRALRDR